MTVIIVLGFLCVLYLALAGHAFFLVGLLFPKPDYPEIPNLREGRDDNLYLNGLIRGGLTIGRPGSGKTVYDVMQVMRRALTFPHFPIFVLDASGSFCDEFIKLTFQLPTEQKEMILRRLIYDRMADPNHTVAVPFFSPKYGLTVEEQVSRVTTNGVNLNQDLVERTPVMGGIALEEIAPNIYRLLCAMRDEHGGCWQIPQARELLSSEAMLRQACNDFGFAAPEAKEYFRTQFLPLPENERKRISYTFRGTLGAIEPRQIKARLNHHTPSWIPKEAIEKGQIVLVSGEVLINQEKAMGILMTDVYSQILAVINNRTPHDPKDKPVLMVIDEVPMLLEIRGMAGEIGKVSPRYRSRNLQIIVIIQMLAQLDRGLREKIWSFGNTVCFGIDSHEESVEIARQLFKYDPKKVRFSPASDTGQPIAEQAQGGYLIAANWIQHLPARAVIMKRWLDGSTEEKYVQYIPRTQEKPNDPLPEPLIDIKERLLKRNSVPIQQAIDASKSRTLTKRKKPPQV